MISKMFAGTRNSPVAKNVMNRMIRVLVSVITGRIDWKTCASKFEFFNPKMFSIINARLINENAKRIRTMISSMDKRAILATNFLMRRTILVS